MNTVSGNDILSYQGNVGLGLGENVQSYGDTDTKIITDSLQNLSYQQLLKNKTVYDQKIKDRDEAFALIAEGKLKFNTV